MYSELIKIPIKPLEDGKNDYYDFKLSKVICKLGAKPKDHYGSRRNVVSFHTLQLYGTLHIETSVKF